MTSSAPRRIDLTPLSTSDRESRLAYTTAGSRTDFAGQVLAEVSRSLATKSNQEEFKAAHAHRLSPGSIVLAAESAREGMLSSLRKLDIELEQTPKERERNGAELAETQTWTKAARGLVILVRPHLATLRSELAADKAWWKTNEGWAEGKRRRIAVYKASFLAALNDNDLPTQLTEVDRSHGRYRLVLTALVENLDNASRSLGKASELHPVITFGGESIDERSERATTKIQALIDRMDRLTPLLKDECARLHELVPVKQDFDNHMAEMKLLHDTNAKLGQSWTETIGGPLRDQIQTWFPNLEGPELIATICDAGSITLAPANELAIGF